MSKANGEGVSKSDAHTKLNQITDALNQKGMPVEAGWVLFRVFFSGLEVDKNRLARLAFFGGALHVYTGLCSKMAASGDEPSEDDLEYIQNLTEELTAYSGIVEDILKSAADSFSKFEEEDGDEGSRSGKTKT